jgi:hypothetical protein
VNEGGLLYIERQAGDVSFLTGGVALRDGDANGCSTDRGVYRRCGGEIGRCDSLRRLAGVAWRRPAALPSPENGEPW